MIGRVSFGQSQGGWRVGFAVVLFCLLGTSSRPASAQPGSSALTDLPARLADKYPNIRSVVLARHDCVEFEYYKAGLDARSLSSVHSVTKSVLSILVGIALDKGYLRLDERLSELLPETLDPTIDPRVRDITVRDLLTMTSGFDSAAPFGARAVVPPREMWQWTLARPIQHKPGSQFDYDDDSVNLLSVALARAIRQDSRSFAEQNLFGPLEIENFDWKADSRGHLIGATTLSLSARDMTKLGLLYLRRGRWGHEQIVSGEYVADSISKHNDGGAPVKTAYGYLWWVTHTGAGLDAFFAAGKGSQIIYVVPRLDLVVTVTSLSSVPGGSVRFVNDVLLPAASDASTPPTCIARLVRERPLH
ncbi:serine hydrolase [Bradyrhizobium liaoningense]|uniref:serine hydrolase domain-containing protein n=1 Tax=Bradyrhizobium liaoningense TaxID=43992 RepID=UPI001BAB9376|nr:serine hydrolase [Bradyrhizobium liaoningense]MBR0716827.1 serine hydrolase [Bradyrhizobium liaoningense]